MVFILSEIIYYYAVIWVFKVKTGLTVHAHTYKDHMLLYKSALNKACSLYYSGVEISGSYNPCTLFSTINKLLKPHNNISSSFTPEKCNNLISFFNSKIENIHNQLATSSATSLVS
ncbi:hypothetical protein PAMP_023273 [Pampus punctatissimus]